MADADSTSVAAFGSASSGEAGDYHVVRPTHEGGYSTPPPSAAGIALSSIFFVEIALAIYALIVTWAPALAVANAGKRAQAAVVVHQSLRYFGFRWNAAGEDVYLVLVLAAGALGSGIAALNSLGWYIGHSALKSRWIPWYLFRIPIGLALPLVVYAGIRGGVLNVGETSSALNPYSMVAIAGITGMFSREVLERLRRWANHTLASAPIGADHGPS
jgi:hypothetical protein